MQLIKWVWGFEYYNFRNMCPYFWLTVFTVVFIPIIALLKGIKYLFIKTLDGISNLVDKWNNYCDKKQQVYYKDFVEKLKADVAKGLTTETTNKFLRWYNIRRGKSNKFYHAIQYLDGDSAYIMIDTIENSLPKPEYTYVEKKPKTNSQIIGKLTILIKWVFKILAVVLAIIILFYAYKFVVWLTIADWKPFYKIVKNLGIILLWIIGCVLSGGLFVLLLGFIGKRIACYFNEYCAPCEARKEKLFKFIQSVLHYISLPFVYLWKGLVFCFDIIVALKKDNCPGLNWED